jgi:Lipocalin-like domain
VPKSPFIENTTAAGTNLLVERSNAMNRQLVSTLMATAILTLAVPVAAQDLASQVVGVWKYTALTTTEVASGKVTKNFGDKPNGYFVLTKGRRFIFSLVGENRAKPAGAGITDAEAVTLFRTLAAGSGTYEIEGSNIIYSYDSSWLENWTGTSQKRKIELAGNKLTVSAQIKIPATGLDAVLVTTFEKVE